MTQPLSATVLSKPDCGPCIGVKKMLTKAGVPFVERDVTADGAARDELLRLHAVHRPGMLPSTPAVLLDGHVFFDAHGVSEYVRRLTRAADAA